MSVKILELIIIQAPAGVSLHAERILFQEGGAGLTIGRDPSSAFCLPDPHKFVSNHHAVVQSEGDRFFLVDLSTNGVFINASDEPVGSEQVVELADGDQFELGEYCLRVDLFTEEVACNPPVSEWVDEPKAMAVPYRQEALQLPEAPMDDLSDQGSVHSALSAGMLDAALAKVRTRTTFLEMLGIDSGQVSAEREEAQEQLVAAVLQEMLSGVRELLNERSKSRSGLCADSTLIQPNQNNPFKFSLNNKQLLKALLGEGGPGYMGPVRAVREAVQDLVNHQRVLRASGEQALRGLLLRLSPGEIEKQLSGVEFPSVQARDAQLWQVYRQSFQQLTDLFGGAQGLCAHLLAEGYLSTQDVDDSRAYEEN